jgi:AbrB family looped-hinge helix DNA binding protein
VTLCIAKVGNQGQVTIPAEIRSSLGIAQGTWVCVTLEDGCVVLEVVSEALVERTRGMLKGGPSLSAAFKQQRRRDITRDSNEEA